MGMTHTLAHSPLAHATASYWIASMLSMTTNRAGFEDMLAIRTLKDIKHTRPSERLACAAGGTLASLGHGIYQTHEEAKIR